MRRLLFIVLLLCLPLQSSWAAINAYCKHETGRAVQHLGHHPHQHRDTSDLSTEVSSQSQKHQDCEACHSHLAGAIFIESDLSSNNQRLVLRGFSQAEPKSAFQAVPERPKWPLV